MYVFIPILIFSTNSEVIDVANSAIEFASKTDTDSELN